MKPLYTYKEVDRICQNMFSVKELKVLREVVKEDVKSYGKSEYYTCLMLIDLRSSEMLIKNLR